MIAVYAKEFVAIVGYCIEHDLAQRGKELLGVPRETMLKLLWKNQYEEPEKKLQVWKHLQWIDADEGRLTKQIYLPQLETKRRLVAIRPGVYEQIKRLL